MSGHSWISLLIELGMVENPPFLLITSGMFLPPHGIMVSTNTILYHDKIGMFLPAQLVCRCQTFLMGQSLEVTQERADLQSSLRLPVVVMCFLYALSIGIYDMQTPWL